MSKQPSSAISIDDGDDELFGMDRNMIGEFDGTNNNTTTGITPSSSRTNNLNGQQKLYPFLSENENLKLKTCLLNFLAVQEYELARAVLIDYFNHVSQSDVIYILNHCIDELKDPKNPHVTSRFKWFCYCVYSELKNSGTNAHFTPYNTDILSFETLLDCCINTFKLSDKFSHELVTQFKYIYAFRSLSKKNKKAQNQITTLSLNYTTHPPSIDNSIFELLSDMYGKCPQIAFFLEQDVFECIGNRFIVVEKIEQLLNDECYEKAAYMLRFLPKNFIEDINVVKSLHSIFSILISKKANRISAKPNSLLIDMIYESLFASDIGSDNSTEFYLIRLFCQIEEDILRGQESAMSKSVNNQTFWINYMEYIRVTNGHVLESRLLTALDMIRKKQFNYLPSLLDHDNFVKLKPLIILLSWDDLKTDVYDLQLLIEKLWKKSGNEKLNICDPWIEFTCNELAYFLDFSVEASELILGANKVMSSTEKKLSKELIRPNRIKKLADNEFKGVSKKEISNALIDYSPKHSIMYLLLPWIPTIRENDLVELLQKRPKQISSEESAKDIDLVLVRAYFAIHETLLLIRNKSISILDSMNAIENSILNISNMVHRLSVLENIFQVIFTKMSHLKQANDTKEEKFIISPNILNILLLFLNQRVNEISGENCEIDAKFTYRAQRFSKILEEAIWRFNLVKLMVDSSNPNNNSTFLQLWTSSPTVLFIVSLKKNLFFHSKDIISRFKLGEEYTTRVLNAETIYSVHTEHEKDIKSVVDKFNTPEVLTDLLFSLNTESKETLSLIINKLGTLNKNLVLDHITTLMEFPYQGPVYKVYGKLFSYETDKETEKLKTYISVEKARSSSLKELCLLENKGTSSDEDVLKLISNLKTDNSRYDYLPILLNKIVENYKILSSNGHDVELFSILRKGVSQIMNELVFETGDCKYLLVGNNTSFY